MVLSASIGSGLAETGTYTAIVAATAGSLAWKASFAFGFCSCTVGSGRLVAIVQLLDLMGIELFRRILRTSTL